MFLIIKQQQLKGKHIDDVSFRDFLLESVYALQSKSDGRFIAAYCVNVCQTSVFHCIFIYIGV